MNRFMQLTLASVLGLAALTAAHADNGQGAKHGAAATSAEADMTDGEVKKVDKDVGKVTIKHGPIVNLDMPNMTMVFRVKDPVMLTQVKEGDKIKFAVDKVNGAFTVVKLETVK